MPEKTFRYCMSPRCFRYREDAIMSHAPQTPGIFEFVTFDANNQAKILYVGLAVQGIAQELSEHLRGMKLPSVKELLEKYPNLYFDYVDWTEAKDVEDLKDIAASLWEHHHPPHSPQPLLGSGRYQKVILQEVDVPVFNLP